MGVTASLPLTPYIGSAVGDWTLNAGLTQYFTDNEVVGNLDDDFLTSTVGLSLAF